MKTWKMHLFSFAGILLNTQEIQSDSFFEVLSWKIIWQEKIPVNEYKNSAFENL